MHSSQQKSIVLKRIFADAALFCAVFLLPWWLVLVFGIIFTFYFERYYELLLAGLAIDSLYTVPLARYWHFQFVVSLVCAGFFLVILSLRRRLRFN